TGDVFRGHDLEALAYPGDFAPVKSKVDVIVVGAYDGPREAGLEIGDFRWRVRVREDETVHDLMGPVHPLDPRRSPYAGSYDDRWLAERWPRRPADFDIRYHNAARPELQLDALRGDEPLSLLRLHPDHEVYRSHLPGLWPRLLLADEGGETMVDLPLRLDTLIVHADTLGLTMLWRGGVPDDAPTTHTYLVTEPVAARRDRAHHEAKFRAHIAVPVAEVLPNAPPHNENEASAAAEREREKKELLAELRKMVAGAGVSSEVLNIAQEEDDPQAIAERLLATLHVDPDAVEKARTENRAQLRQQLAEQGHDPTLLDQLEATPAPSSPLDREEVARRVAAGESLAGEDLSGLDLSGLDLAHARLGGARLTDARLGGASLVSADLTGAVLEGADLSRADLSYAQLVATDLTGARLTETSFTGADLSRARLAQSQAPRCSFVGAVAAGALFQAMGLDEARFDGANLSDALFEGCTLSGTRFVEATVERTSFSQCRGLAPDFSDAKAHDLRAERCAFDGIVLSRTHGPRSSWVDCTLTHAKAELSRFAGGAFLRTDWSGAQLRGSDLRRGLLSHAVLAGADLRQATLCRARLDHADLRGADLTEASIVCADLHFSQRQGACFDGAHLYRTILDERAPSLPPEV
ncbi:MAG: pentapeptide repeat-containing protein, partial [Myxococcota bacterium]